MKIQLFRLNNMHLNSWTWIVESTSAICHHLRRRRYAMNARHHPAIRASVIRTLHRLGMTARVEIRPFGASGRPPALFITVERAVLKLSQAAMSVLAQEAVAHARSKYATVIEGVYWRIEADFDKHEEMEEGFGPTTLGYLVEEAVVLDQDVEALGKLIQKTEAAIVAAEGVAQSIPQVDGPTELARHVRESIDRRRHERGLGGTTTA